MRHLIIALLLTSCGLSQNEYDNLDSSNEWPKLSEAKGLHAEIIYDESSNYGFNIYMDNLLLIHQPMIPGVPGKMGFASREDANQTAKLVIEKIQSQNFPPTITRRELDSLGVW